MGTSTCGTVLSSPTCEKQVTGKYQPSMIENIKKYVNLKLIKKLFQANIDE
jgi:hypothetical protein